MSVLARRRRHEATEERSGTFTVQQLGLLLGAYPGTLAVSSIDEALRDAATWACVSVKAKNIAALPVDVVRYDGNRRVPVTAPKVIDKPSDMVRRRVWTHQLAVSMFTDGNVFGQITQFDASQRPASIELIDPSTVSERKVIDGIKQVRVGGRIMREYPFGDLWHVAGEFVQAGSPFGLSPVFYGQKHVATALAAEAFGGKFFTEGGHPTALLKPSKDPGKDGATALKRAFTDATRGSREPAVLPQDILYEKIQIDPKDSQFIDLMGFEVLQACRRHGVPPSMVFAAVSGQNVTYANVTEADLMFLKHTLSYPIDLIEDALSDLQPPGLSVRLNRDAILRATPDARWDLHIKRLQHRTTTVNQVLALEDEAPVDDPAFDVPGIPGENARIWQEVGLPALVGGGLVSVNEGRQLLGLPPVPGGDELIDPRDVFVGDQSTGGTA